MADDGNSVIGMCHDPVPEPRSELQHLGSDPRVADVADERTVRSDERRLVARELQHRTEQLLSVLDVDLVKLQHLTGFSENGMAPGLLAELDTTIAELHEAVRAIGSSDQIPPVNLAARIASMAASFGLRTGVDIRTCVAASPSQISEKVSTTIFRVAQEAIANARRHGLAHTVSVKVLATDRAICLTVADDGIGMEKSAERPGQGLANMEARVAEAGGQFKIGADVVGTILTATFPIAAAA